MTVLSANEMLFYGGIAVMALAAVGAVIAAAGFSISGRRLRKKLEEEFGKRQDV